MAAGDADLAVGIILKYSTDGVTYTELEDIDELGEPGSPEAPDVDITPLAPSSSFRKFKRGLYKGGDFTFSQFYAKARMTTLQTARNAASDYYWRIIIPDHATEGNRSKIEFTGPVKKCTLRAITDPDDPMVIMVTVTVNSDPVHTAGS